MSHASDLIVNETRDGSVVVPGDGRHEMDEQRAVTVCGDDARQRLHCEHTLRVVHVKLQRASTTSYH